MFDELIKQNFIHIYLKNYQLIFGETSCISAFVAIFIFRHQNTKALKLTKSILLKLNRTTRYS
jgi:uncharacterized integral membrane protein